MSDTIQRRDFLKLCGLGSLFVTFPSLRDGTVSEIRHVTPEERHRAERPPLFAGVTKISGLESMAQVGGIVYVEPGRGATMTYSGDPHDALGVLQKFLEPGFGEVFFFESKHLRMWSE